MILAGVSLSLVAGEQGILNKAEKAVSKTEMMTAKEEVEMWLLELKMKYQEELNYGTDFSEFSDYLETQINSYNQITPSGFLIDIGNGDIEVYKKEQVFLTGILENGKVIWDLEANQKEKQPTPAYAKLYTDGTLIFSRSEYTDPTKEVAKDGGNIADFQFEFDDKVFWYRDTCTNVILYQKIIPKSFKFYALRDVTTIDVSKLDTSCMTDMGYMFGGCNSLENIDISRFNTSKVENMYFMFGGCKKLTNIDLRSFDTKNVINMGDMFVNCASLKVLDVSNIDTSNVVDLSFMFAGCQGLASLDVSHFNTQNVTNMSNMFFDCNRLTQLDLSNWDIGNVTNMNNMFYNCNNLTVYVKDQEMKNKIESFSGNEGVTIVVKNL